MSADRARARLFKLITNLGLTTIFCEIQGSAKRQSTGLVNFVTALAYHFYLALPASFTQPGDHLLAEPCRHTDRDWHELIAGIQTT